MFIYMPRKFQPVLLMHMRVTIVLVKLCFLHVEGFKMEQGAVIMFSVKLKKTANEMSAMLRCEYGECLSRTSVFESH
jgi:hypothetical protein